MLNSSKSFIDQLKAQIDRKEEERKIRHRDDQLHQTDGFKDEPEEIIDEEELQLLRKMKQYKQEYREKFSVLKNVKGELAEAQMQTDVLKEKLISGFENWYLQEFDAPSGNGPNLYDQEFGRDQEELSS